MQSFSPSNYKNLRVGETTTSATEKRAYRSGAVVDKEAALETEHIKHETGGSPIYRKS